MPSVPRDYTDNQKLTFPDVNSILRCLRWILERLKLVPEAPKWVQTPVGGIAAGPTSWANCKIGARDPDTGAMVAGTADLKVFNNPGAGAVDGAVWVQVHRCAGCWSPLWEAC